MPRTRPLLLAGVAVGALAIVGTASAAPVGLTFDGPGTGFTGTQAGTDGLGTGVAGSPAPVVAGGNLSLTSNAGLLTTQINALQISPGITGSSYYAESNLLIPALATPFQEAGIWVGRDVNANVKLTLQQGPTGPRIELYRAGDSTAEASHRSVSLAGATSIRLTLQVNTVANVVVGKYNLFGPGGQIGNTQSAGYVQFAGMGTANDKVGVQTSNFGAQQTITANYEDFSTGTIGIDVTPPTLVATTPSAGQGGVPTTGPIGVTFSETMDPTSLASSFTLTGPNGPVGASVDSVAGSNATKFVLTPSAALVAGATYTASLSGEARDQYGNPLAATSWSFTTAGGAAPVVAPPPVATAPILAPTPILSSLPPVASKGALKVSLSTTRTVKRGGKASLTLRFSRTPSTLVTVSRKQGKAFKSVLKRRAAKALTILKVPVGTKTGKVQFRVAYKDGAINRTSLFAVTVVR